MRLVEITVPEGEGDPIRDIAFAVGASSVATSRGERCMAGGKAYPQESIRINLSTPKAKAFTERLFASPDFDPKTMQVVVRTPVLIRSTDPPEQITRPVYFPGDELLHELWQFSHVTWSFAVRVAIAAGLLAYGVIHGKLLLIISGLLFMPVLPPLMAISFGAVSGHWRLAANGFRAVTTALAIVVATGFLIGLLEAGPIAYDDFPSLPTLAIIASSVGLAAALAGSDDAGKRELIGLAAAAQISLLPSWLGIALAKGEAFSGLGLERVWLLVCAIVCILAGAGITYLLVGYRRQGGK